LKEENTLTGRLFVLAIYLATFTAIGHAFLNSVGGVGIYNRVYFFGYDMHRFTVLVIFISFLFHWGALKYLYPLARFVAASIFTTWYIYFHHVLWNANSLLFRGSAAWVIPFLGTVFLTVLLYLMNIKRGFLKISFKFYDKLKVVALLLFQLVGLAGMAATGFWEAMKFCDLGLPGPNPNMSPWWLLWKAASFWMLYPLIWKGKSRAPLRMDPGVF